MPPASSRRLPTLVITGFGPFPGVPVNASGLMAKKLGNLAARRFRGHRIVSRELTVDWTEALEKLEALYEREKPRLALHFGVSEKARGLVIETVARNATQPTLDFHGRLPPARTVQKDAPSACEATIPAAEIASRLKRLDIPSSLSDDAGRYLCNALFYASLRRAAEMEPPGIAAFVHLPVSLAGAGRKLTEPAAGCPLTWECALTGGLEIMRAALGRPAPRLLKTR